MNRRIVLVAVVAIAVAVAIAVTLSSTLASSRKTVYPGYPKIPGSSPHSNPLIPASSPAASVMIPAPSPGGNAINRPRNTLYSKNWSGYTAISTARGAFWQVKSTWIEPSVSCSGSSSWQMESAWVGLDGANSTTVEQLGTYGQCLNGVVSYRAWYEMYPAYQVNLSGTVLPGDHLTAEVNRSGDSYTLTIADSTRHWSHVIHRSGSFKDTSAEAIMEAPYSGGILPLADFHTAHFTSTEINGGARTTIYAVDMVNASNTAYLDTVSSVTGGGAWSAYWDRSR